MGQMWRCSKYLLLCVLAIAVELPESSVAFIRRDDCRRGAVVIGEFYENPCRRERNDPFPKLRRNGLTYEQPVTVAKVRDYMTRYCSIAMPEVRRCFANIISRCGEAEQQYLNDLARNTSEICESNGDNISPWLDYVLSRLTDEDVAVDSSCPREDDFSVHSACVEEARNTSGILNYGEAYIQYASVEELLPIVQSYYGTQLECHIRGLRDLPNRCSNWKFIAMVFALSMTGPPPLGLQLNYTGAQMGEMFGFSDRRRNSDVFPFLP